MSTAREDANTAIFGAVDAATGVVGALAGLTVVHASATAILTVAGGATVANAIGMAGGLRLSGSTWRAAGVMATACLLVAGVLTVTAAYLPWGAWGVLGWLIFLGAGVAEARVRLDGARRALSHGQTYTILAITTIAAVAAALCLGAAG